MALIQVNGELVEVPDDYLPPPAPTPPDLSETDLTWSEE
jgi:hypothetical protein